MDKNIVEKVRKLLALSESSNENEAKAAMSMAQKLMAKHKLEISDVEMAETKVVTKTTGIFYTTKEDTWKNSLMRVISDNYCTGMYSNRFADTEEREIVLMGFEEDIKVCLDLFQYASEYIEKHMIAEKALFKFSNHDEFIRAENSYGHGFSMGLETVLEAQREANKEEWGLVMKTPNEVTEFIDSIESCSHTIKDNSLKELYYKMRGYKAGTKVDFTNKITD